MGTRIGYVVRGNNDETDLAAGIMLFSHEHERDAEGVFRQVANESIGPTDFMTKLSAINTKTEAGKDLPIFWVDACHEDAERVLTVTWDQMRPKGEMAIFS